MTQAEMKKEFFRIAKILNAHRKQDAKSEISRADRARTTLSNQELVLRWCQLGYGIRYKDVHFRIDDDECWGVLIKANGQQVIYAALDDFYNEVEQVYGKNLRECSLF